MSLQHTCPICEKSSDFDDFTINEDATLTCPNCGTEFSLSAQVKRMSGEGNPGSDEPPAADGMDFGGDFQQAPPGEAPPDKKDFGEEGDEEDDEGEDEGGEEDEEKPKKKAKKGQENASSARKSSLSESIRRAGASINLGGSVERAVDRLLKEAEEEGGEEGAGEPAPEDKPSGRIVISTRNGVINAVFASTLATVDIIDFDESEGDPERADEDEARLKDAEDTLEQVY